LYKVSGLRWIYMHTIWNIVARLQSLLQPNQWPTNAQRYLIGLPMSGRVSRLTDVLCHIQLIHFCVQPHDLDKRDEDLKNLPRDLIVICSLDERNPIKWAKPLVKA